MKKFTLQFIIFLMLIAGGVNAQNLISIQNGNNPIFYTKLDSAIFHAQNGDTIYLPGGNFTISDTIDKCLHFEGVGHHPDSTTETSRTIISGNKQLILKSGADNGSVTGIYFNYPDYYYGYPNIQILDSISGYLISRCYITKQLINFYSNNLTIAENIIVSIYSNGNNTYCTNNIILGYATINSGVIKNNIFTFSDAGYAAYALYPGNNIVENNIFKPYSISTNGGASIYNNNVNGGVNGINGQNQGSGNFLDNVELPSIFVNYNPADDIYNADFHLPSNSPYKNAGRDGSDLGIYGGAFPWKPGSVPFNPHLQSVNIPGATDQNGNLNVNIKVSAQDR
jgi:hypothetical protein